MAVIIPPHRDSPLTITIKELVPTDCPPTSFGTANKPDRPPATTWNALTIKLPRKFVVVYALAWVVVFSYLLRIAWINEPIKIRLIRRIALIKHYRLDYRSVAEFWIFEDIWVPDKRRTRYLGCNGPLCAILSFG